jgi:putative chitinase
MSLYMPAPLLAKLWPHCPAASIAAISASTVKAFPNAAIDTLLNLQDFIAECSEETGGGMAFVESGKYSASRAMEVWPSLFPTLAAAQAAVANPRILFDKTYGGRLGNRPGTDDGYNFRGRGAIQITGREWYTEIAKDTGLDIVNNPDLAALPQNVFVTAASFWKLDKVAPLVGNLRAEVKKINGGYTNMAAREAWEALCQKLITIEEATFAPPPPKPPIIVGGTTVSTILHPTFVQEFEAFMKRWL